MKNSTKLLIVVVGFFLSFVTKAFAVSYFPPGPYQQEELENVTLSRGDIAYIFYGVTGERSGVLAGDVLKVYREDHLGKGREVGRIRVLSSEGENYYRSIVLEGEIRYGDVARKGGVSCLILLNRPND